MLETVSVEVFLGDCLEVAKAKQYPQVASITLPFQATDMMACIPEGFHCYLEKPDSEEAVLAIGALVESSYSGPSRFEKAKAFWNEISDNAHFFTPDPIQAPTDFRCFSAFTFFDTTACKFSPFQPANIFIPKYQLNKNKAKYTLTVNLLIDPQYTTKKIKQVYHDTIIKSKELSKIKQEQPQSTSNSIDITFMDSNSAFIQSIESALENIKAKKYQKIVLARAATLHEKKGTFDPHGILTKLNTAYPNCYIFSFNSGRSSTFLGASPERLFKKDRIELVSESIAGSRPRGDTEDTDTSLSNELQSSTKDQLEQNIITESLIRKFKKLGLQPFHQKTPTVIKLAGLQHLKTTISADLIQSLDSFDILKTLHPTPAVGGEPFEPASKDIQKLEAFDRNLYAGPIGWINQRGESEFIVGIRSGVVDGKQARIYAGAGIVDESIPEKELEEVDLKLKGLYRVIN